jgi:hypothetical protein
MKICRKCNTKKPLSDFRKKIDGKYGVGAQCKLCINLMQAPNKPHRHLVGKDRQLYKKYGVTSIEVENIKRQQNYKCAICHNFFKNKTSTHIDHCHDSKKVRGILCFSCNVGLGHFKDSQDNLKSAQNYLKRYSQL